MRKERSLGLALGQMGSGAGLCACGARMKPIHHVLLNRVDFDADGDKLKIWVLRVLRAGAGTFNANATHPPNSNVDSLSTPTSVNVSTGISLTDYL